MNELLKLVLAAVLGAIAKEMVGAAMPAIRARLKVPPGMKPWLTKEGLSVLFDMVGIALIFALGLFIFGFGKEPATHADLSIALVLVFGMLCLALALVWDIVRVIARTMKEGLFSSIEGAMSKGPSPAQSVDMVDTKD